MRKRERGSKGAQCHTQDPAPFFFLSKGAQKKKGAQCHTQDPNPQVQN